jgi:fibronectin type 3 domain-containing protein
MWYNVDKQLRLPKRSGQKLLLPFVLLFGVIGALLLIRSLAAGSSVISGTLFDDANRNGVVDSGEAPFANKALALYRQQDSTWVAGVVTDASGKFVFSGLDDSNYYVAASRSVWTELRGDYVPSFTTISTDFELPVSLIGSAHVNFGLRKIIRSRVIEQPISTVTSPKGMIIRSYNDAVTAQQILDVFNKGSLRGEEEKTTKVYFDYQSSAFCSSSYAGSPGTFNAFSASCWIDWLSWVDTGDQVLFHEYGHAWSHYYEYIVQQDGTFNKYLAARGLTGDSRIGTNVYWDPKEMIAEDYRQLFGSESARSFAQANKDIPPAKDVPNLETYLSITYMASSTDTIPPSSPTNVVAKTESPTQINLSWSASTDNSGVIKEYEVYRNGALVRVITSPTTNSFESGLTPDTSYQYYVRARDQAGNVSPSSATATAKTPSIDNTAPSQPTALTATSITYNSVGLAWQASSDDASIVSYRIYTGVTGKRARPVLIGTATNTSFNVTGLKRGTNYSYWVTAVDSSGNESLPSNAISVKTKR